MKNSIEDTPIECGLKFVVLLVILGTFLMLYVAFSPIYDPVKPAIEDYSLAGTISDSLVMPKLERAQRACEDPAPFTSVSDCVRYFMRREK